MRQRPTGEGLPVPLRLHDATSTEYRVLSTAQRVPGPEQLPGDPLLRLPGRRSRLAIVQT